MRDTSVVQLLLEGAYWKATLLHIRGALSNGYSHLIAVLLISTSDQATITRFNQLTQNDHHPRWQCFRVCASIPA
jgi:hypothetical protein